MLSMVINISKSDESNEGMLQDIFALDLVIDETCNPNGAKGTDHVFVTALGSLAGDNPAALIACM